MASKKVGTLIKEARTSADLTQEQLARKISGLSASDISLAERGQKDLTQAQLKQIAKVTGVTQASLLNAAKGTSPAKKTTKKTETAKKASTSSAAKSSSVKVTAAEKKLLELYRKADSETKKSVMNILKGEEETGDSVLEDILGVVQSMLEFPDGSGVKITGIPTENPTLSKRSFAIRFILQTQNSSRTSSAAVSFYTSHFECLEGTNKWASQ